MLRDTMIRTMPVAMTAIDVLWTDRFHRFRAVRKSPPERMLNAIQMATSAITMPSSRVSISDWASTERHVWRDGGAVVAELGVMAVAGCSGERTSVMHHALPIPGTVTTGTRHARDGRGASETPFRGLSRRQPPSRLRR